MFGPLDYLPKTPCPQKRNSSSRPYLTTVYVTFQEQKQMFCRHLRQIPFEESFFAVCLSVTWEFPLDCSLFLTAYCPNPTPKNCDSSRNHPGFKSNVDHLCGVLVDVQKLAFFHSLPPIFIYEIQIWIYICIEFQRWQPVVILSFPCVKPKLHRISPRVLFSRSHSPPPNHGDKPRVGSQSAWLVPGLIHLTTPGGVKAVVPGNVGDVMWCVAVVPSAGKGTKWFSLIEEKPTYCQIGPVHQL